MLLNPLPYLKKAQKKKVAIPAFNVTDLETIQAVIAAATKTNSPVFISTSEGAIAYAGLEELAALVKIEAKKTKVPIFLHLDHGKDLRLIQRCLKLGYTSIMFDGSALPYKQNVATTKKVVAWAKKYKVPVEAELGTLAGLEDFVSLKDAQAHLTDPSEAKKFVKETGCSSLAIAIGTKHGPFKFQGQPHLDFARLAAIKKLVKVPLVLHGASSLPETYILRLKKAGGNLKTAKGIPPALWRKAIRGGICKINIDSDLRLAFTTGVREYLKKNKNSYDIRTLLGGGTKEIQKMAEWVIKQLGGQKIIK